MLGGGVEVPGAWDIDRLWAEREATLTGEYAHAYATVEGNRTFRYRLAEWRFETEGYEVSYDVMGGGQARHAKDRAADELKGAVHAWFDQRDGTASLAEIRVTHIRC